MREDKRERECNIRWEETKRTRRKRNSTQGGGVSERKKQDHERKREIDVQGDV